MVIFKNIENLNIASTRDRFLKNTILRAASVRKLFRRSRLDEMQNFVFFNKH